jgi:L-rhamnose mutarotase
MKRYYLALDLKDDPDLIKEYEEHHKNVWPEIINSIKNSGIEVLDIYRTGNRMFMIIEGRDDFSFEKKGTMDAANPAVQEWEKLMWKFQQALPWAKPGEKWILMEKIFTL